jgi:hypothetical protein
MPLVLPTPVDPVEWAWIGVGITFGRAFGKNLDRDIKASEWFQRRHPFWRNLVARLLDCLHHWYIGALLMAYASLIAAWLRWPSLHQEIFWFGAGLLIDDMPDIPPRIRRFYNGYLEYWNSVG